MSEDPIKLFNSRSERYPEATDGDVAHKAVEKIIDQIPVAGPIVTFVLSQFLTPSLERRRNEWLKELAQALEQLETESSTFRVENLEHDEAFISATIKATQTALRTHQEEKRTMLRNALLNIATGKAPNEEFQHIFLSLIEEFSVSHIKILDVLWRGGSKMAREHGWDMAKTPISRRNYGTAIEILIPELKSQQNLVQYILSDLRNRGFTSLGDLNLTFPQGTPITNMGIQFLQFVLASE